MHSPLCLHTAWQRHGSLMSLLLALGIGEAKGWNQKDTCASPPPIHTHLDSQGLPDAQSLHVHDIACVSVDAKAGASWLAVLRRKEASRMQILAARIGALIYSCCARSCSALHVPLAGWPRFRRVERWPGLENSTVYSGILDKIFLPETHTANALCMSISGLL